MGQKLAPAIDLLAANIGTGTETIASTMQASRGRAHRLETPLTRLEAALWDDWPRIRD